jgi:hypothetical protein
MPVTRMNRGRHGVGPDGAVVGGRHGKLFQHGRTKR